jgi:glycosyltransferase involved in cell wall biosynthesis
MPQISFFMRGGIGGGVERVVANLLNAWARQGLKVDLVLACDSGPVLQWLSPAVRVVNLNSRSVGRSLFKLVRYLRENCPQHLIAALHYPCEIAILARFIAGVPTRIVVTEHNALSIDAARSPYLSTRLAPWGTRLLYPCADHIIAVSQGVADDLAQLTGLARSRIQVIYNPIVYPGLVAAGTEPLDHPWFQPGEPPALVAVGRLVPQKDIPTLLRAFAQLTDQRWSQVRLVVIGEGAERSALEALTDQLHLGDRVCFCGFQNNPHAYIAQATALILSSQWEGFGNVLVEAMALGTPVITTACPYGPAEVVNGGRYGHLVQPADDRALAQAMQAVLEGDRRLAPPDWLQQFDCEYVAHRYLAVLGSSPQRCSTGLRWVAKLRPNSEALGPISR